MEESALCEQTVPQSASCLWAAPSLPFSVLLLWPEELASTCSSIWKPRITTVGETGVHPQLHRPRPRLPSGSPSFSHDCPPGFLKPGCASFLPWVAGPPSYTQHLCSCLNLASVPPVLKSLILTPWCKTPTELGIPWRTGPLKCHFESGHKIMGFAVVLKLRVYCI